MNGFSLKMKVLALVIMAAMGFGLVSMQINAEPQKPKDKSEHKPLAPEANAKPADTAKPADAPKLADSAIGFTSRPELREDLELDLSRHIGVSMGVKMGATGNPRLFLPRPGNGEGSIGSRSIGHRFEGIRRGHQEPPGNNRTGRICAGRHNPFDGTSRIRIAQWVPFGLAFGMSENLVGLCSHAFRTVNLNPDPTKGNVFGRDGRTFRTVRTEAGKKSIYTQLEVCSVSVETGKVLKTLLTIDGEFIAFHLAATGKQIALMDVRIGSPSGRGPSNETVDHCRKVRPQVCSNQPASDSNNSDVCPAIR